MPTQDKKLTGYRRWNTTGANIYTKSGYVDVVKLCNGFTATNIGADIVRINEAILYPVVPGTSLGDSRTFGGNEGEIYVGTIRVAFAAAVNPQVEIIQKFYVAEDDEK